MNKVIVAGAGGYGRSVADAILASAGHVLVGFADERWPDLPLVWDLPVLGKVSQLSLLRGHADAIVVAIGHNANRQTASEQARSAGFSLLTVVHPRAIVSPRAVIGQGVTIMAGAVIGCDVQIGDGAIINAAAVIDHDCEVGAFAHVGIGACMPGGARLGSQAWLQEGCALAPGQRVLAGSVIAAARTAARTNGSTT